jgi:hypothetical protein
MDSQLPGVPRSRAPAGYLMLKSLEIEHFRGFKKLKITDLSRVNVITGPNTSGKTAILEAILLGLRAGPYAVTQINQQRGLPIPNSPVYPGLPGTVSSTIQFRSIWDNLFHEFDITIPIKIRFKDSKRYTYSLTIEYKNASSPTETLLSDPTSIGPVTFERSKNDPRGSGHGHTVFVAVNPQGQIVTNGNTDPLGPASAFFSSHTLYPEQDNVTWFSNLSMQNREEIVTDLIKAAFPFITKLELLAPNFQNVLWATVGKLKQPVGLVSAGVNKVMSFSLASASYENGVVIMDELENGIWHEFYGDFWSFIYEIAKKKNNQIFVSTHSLECLRALAPIVEGNESDFCLLRARREEEGNTVRQLTGKALSASLSGRGEMR